jgi:4-hydroxythreonine-4-phosphate dehydrogenase
MNSKPRLLITMGDVAGIGPEVLAKAWPELTGLCQLIVVGDVNWMRRAVAFVGSAAQVLPITAPAEAEPQADRIPCIQGTVQQLDDVKPGRIRAEAGRAAYDFLCAAIDWTLQGRADGIVTLPLHKEGLRAAGLNYPGHTEILAERTALATSP